MNKKERKHNIRVYTESVKNEKERGGFYVMGAMNNGVECPLSKTSQYLNNLAQQKMNKNGIN